MKPQNGYPVGIPIQKSLGLIFGPLMACGCALVADLHPAAAAARARDIYLSLVAVGWEPTLARFKKLKATAAAANNERQCTIGEFLDAVAEAATNRSTVEGSQFVFAKGFGTLGCHYLLHYRSKERVSKFLNQMALKPLKGRLPRCLLSVNYVSERSASNPGCRKTRSEVF